MLGREGAETAAGLSVLGSAHIDHPENQCDSQREHEPVHRGRSTNVGWELFRFAMLLRPDCRLRRGKERDYWRDRGGFRAEFHG
jgi:hypothetical protein